MKRLITAKQMKHLDALCTSEAGISGLLLMENAALEAVHAMEQQFGRLSGRQFIIVCGKGNNAGDGFAMARHLQNRGGRVEIVFLNDAEDLPPDARTNYDIAQNMEITVSGEFPAELETDAVIVDAIFGIGVHGEITDRTYRSAIEWINQSGTAVVAVDIPSGIDADRGSVCGCAVKADLTCTFAFCKPGLAVLPGAAYAGKVAVCHISTPDYVANMEPADTFLLEEDCLQIPPAALDANKGSMGRVCIVAGSTGMTGAACLAAEAALRTGAGLIRVAAPRNLNAVLEVKLTEQMTVPLPADHRLDETCLDMVRRQCRQSDVLLLGPGLGRAPETERAVQQLVRETEIPIILDADGINAVSRNINILQEKQAPVIVTPHPGEFARLTGLPVAEIQQDRLRLARMFAVQHDVVLVLKGAKTVIAYPDGTAYVNPTGNPGMATGGSGDVLAGIIAALEARGALNSAAVGTFLHGMAGDRAAAELGMAYMAPTDIIRHLSGCL